MYCHECRYCCTLSVCTTKKGSSFRFSNKSLNDAQETGSNSEPTAAFGFLTDQRMFKNPDFRCLKPNPKIPSSKWGHFEMHGYRAAKTKAELGKQMTEILTESNFVFRKSRRDTF